MCGSSRRAGRSAALFDHGLFRPADELWWDRATPDGIGNLLGWAIRHELDWFERELPVPRRAAFCVKSRRRWLAHGMCWFQPDAGEMWVSEIVAPGHDLGCPGDSQSSPTDAHVLAALIGEAGVSVTKRTTHRLDTILYADAWQVVAKPDEATPTRWC